MTQRDSTRRGARRRLGRKLGGWRIRVAPVLFIAATGCGEFRRADFAGTPAVVSDSLLRFPSGVEIATGLSQVSYIGQLPTEDGSPFLIIEGNDCSACDALPSVLLWRPSDGPIPGIAGRAGAYLYPGRVISAGDARTVLSESRVFWGECLYSSPPGLFQYLTDYGLGDHEPARQVHITAIVGDSLIESQDYATKPFLTYTLSQVQDHKCFEIPRRVMMAPG